MSWHLISFASDNFVSGESGCRRPKRKICGIIDGAQFFFKRTNKKSGSSTCMAINLSVQNNGDFLPDIILLTLCYFLFFFSLISLIADGPHHSLPSCLWSLRIFPSLPGSRLTIFLSRCKFSTLTTRQPMVAFYLLTFPRFPLRKKEHKSYFGKNRTHDFRTSRYAGYLLDYSGDDYHLETQLNAMKSFCPHCSTYNSSCGSGARGSIEVQRCSGGGKAI